MIYELRRYETLPGKMAALNEVMENLGIPIFKKVGMRLVAAWVPLVGDYSNALQYILAWESMNEREEKWKTFFAHPDWIKGREEIGKKYGPIVDKEIHYFLEPTSYSPLK